MNHKSYICLFLRSQHCHSWSFTITGVLTDSLLTVQTECTINEAVLVFFPYFLSRQRVFDARLNSLQQRSVFSPVCVCAMGGNDTCEPSLDINGNFLQQSFFFSFSSLQQMSISGEANQSICFTLFYPLRCPPYIFCTCQNRGLYTQYVQLL